jgi:uncharacterized protein (DUF362 family)
MPAYRGVIAKTRKGEGAKRERVGFDLARNNCLAAYHVAYLLLQVDGANPSTMSNARRRSIAPLHGRYATQAYFALRYKMLRIRHVLPIGRAR